MSATTPERLVRMANQIAAEFANQQPGNAAAATSEHIRLFWDPRMLAQMLGHMAAGGAELSPIAAAAIGMLRDGTPDAAANGR